MKKVSIDTIKRNLEKAAVELSTFATAGMPNTLDDIGKCIGLITALDMICPSDEDDTTEDVSTTCGAAPFVSGTNIINYEDITNETESVVAGFPTVETPEPEMREIEVDSLDGRVVSAVVEDELAVQET